MADGSDKGKNKGKRRLRRWVDKAEALTHSDGEAPGVAVALSYDMDADEAPRVVAKGEGEVAERIVEIALANGIKVRRDADLAAVLSAIEIDAEIPYEAFTAVAEILSYVYQANSRMGRKDGTARRNGDEA